MFRSIAALLAAVSCVAVAQAQETPAAVAGALPYTLEYPFGEGRIAWS